MLGRRMIEMNNIVAIIAGDGALPEAICSKLHREGIPVYLFPLADDVRSLSPYVTEIIPVTSLNLQVLLEKMLIKKVDTVILAGRVPKSLMYNRAALDELLRLSLCNGGTNDDHALLGRIVQTIERSGLRVAGYRSIVPELLADMGFIAGRQPTEQEKRDIEYGRYILSHTLSLSFGQSVVVCDGSVVAIEAMEGTDAMLKRAGELVRGGSVVKMMRADQDERFDIPVVGPLTLEGMKTAGQTCLALEAGRTLILEKEQFLQLAESANISVVGVESCQSL